MAALAIGTNWSGNYAYRAAVLHRPRAVEELQELVSGAGPLRVLGSRHSFTSIADSASLVALDGLPGEIVVDATAETVSVPPWVTYAALAEALNRAGLALEEGKPPAALMAQAGSGHPAGVTARSVRRCCV